MFAKSIRNCYVVVLVFELFCYFLCRYGVYSLKFSIVFCLFYIRLNSECNACVIWADSRWNRSGQLLDIGVSLLKYMKN
jgi:hypothetical protein